MVEGVDGIQLSAGWLGSKVRRREGGGAIAASWCKSMWRLFDQLGQQNN